MFKEPNPQNHGFPKLTIDEKGTKRWFLNGEFHREDGPAIEYVDGKKSWWFNDKLHKTNGPAVEYPDGTREYWINGKRYSEEEFWEEVKNYV